MLPAHLPKLTDFCWCMMLLSVPLPLPQTFLKVETSKENFLAAGLSFSMLQWVLLASFPQSLCYGYEFWAGSICLLYIAHPHTDTYSWTPTHSHNVKPCKIQTYTLASCQVYQLKFGANSWGRCWWSRWYCCLYLFTRPWLGMCECWTCFLDSSTFTENILTLKIKTLTSRLQKYSVHLGLQ